MVQTVDETIREFKDMGVEGFVRFSIKAEDTDANKQIHDAFKQFCKVECANDYTLGLKTLLKAYETDYKYIMLFEQIQELRTELEALKDKQKVEKDTGAF